MTDSATSQKQQVMIGDERRRDKRRTLRKCPRCSARVYGFSQHLCPAKISVTFQPVKRKRRKRASMLAADEAV